MAVTAGGFKKVGLGCKLRAALASAANGVKEWKRDFCLLLPVCYCIGLLLSE